MKGSKDRESVRVEEIGEIKRRFEETLFFEPDEGSVFAAYPHDQIIRASESVLDREDELRRDTEEFFGLLTEVIKSEPKAINPVMKAVSRDMERGTTYSRAALELVKKGGAPGVRSQIYVSELAPINDPELSETRYDAAVRGERDSALASFASLSRFSTSGAVEKRREVIERVTLLTRTPIEYVDIQYQRVQGRDIDPRIGLRIIRYLDGYQAFPVIYEGKQAVRLLDRPLFNEPSEITFKDLGKKLVFGIVPERQFKLSSLHRLKEAVFSKFKF